MVTSLVAGLGYLHRYSAFYNCNSNKMSGKTFVTTDSPVLFHERFDKKSYVPQDKTTETSSTKHRR
jgi:hypothetical protein